MILVPVADPEIGGRGDDPSLLIPFVPALPSLLRISLLNPAKDSGGAKRFLLGLVLIEKFNRLISKN